MSHDLIGHTLKDRYYLRDFAGSGGTSNVFQAWDNIRATKMAVKVLRRDLHQKSSSFSLFANEAELLHRLEHPNIVRIYEFDEDKGIYFLVMDWIEGVDLRNKIHKQNQPISLEEISHILGSICNALNYVHKINVYHCDVKPSNILLHQDGRVLLADFGVACLTDISGKGGTPPYMSPEQFMGGKIGPYSDIYGLGVTLYEMISGGQLPFRGDSPSNRSKGSTLSERIAWEHVNLPIPPPRIFNPNIAAPVEQVIMKALDKAPNKRYGSALEFVDAFEQARMMTGPEEKSTSFASAMIKTIFQIKPIPTHPLSANLLSEPIRKIPMENPSVRFTGPHLYGRSGHMVGQIFKIPKHGALIIGRNSTNDISLPDPSVSRVHASIIITPRGIYIQDMGSLFGTLLNGKLIQAHLAVVLKHGDVIQIGHQQLLEFRTKRLFEATK